ncbi:MAG: YraN family protein [Candidatus Coproplasma sp.]
MAIRGERRRLGFRGEAKAVRFLKRQGYTIVARNYRCPCGEVDIIAEKDGELAFIEVKTRSDISFGQPNEAVNAERRRRYVSAARYYFSGRTPDCVIRFDIIEILKGRINHIENAFGA